MIDDDARRSCEARVRELMARCDDVILVMIEVAKVADQLLEELQANGPTPLEDDPAATASRVREPTDARSVALVRRLHRLPALWLPIFEDLLAGVERSERRAEDPEGVT